MKIKTIISAVFIALITISAGWSQETNKFKTFDQLDTLAMNLIDADSAGQAIDLLIMHRDQFPAKDFEISSWVANLCVDNGDHDKAMAIWEDGHQKGYFYLLNPRMPRYKALESDERFKNICDNDSQLRREALKDSKTIYQAIMPGGFLPDKKYPMLIVLHGGGSTIERAQKNWKSDKLSNECITVFIQSYLHYDTKTFGWRGSDTTARNDIQNIYNELIAKYPVDTDRVIIGGISAGGFMAFDIMANNVIPIKGVLGVCPGKPRELDSTMAAGSNDRGVRVFMVAGETDFYTDRQKEMANIFDAVGLPYEYHIVEGLGHDYPDNFESWIDRGIEYIFNA